MPRQDERDMAEIKSLSKLPDDPRGEEEILRNLVGRNPIELEPQLDTLSDPLIIECACPGWQPRQWPPRDAYPREPPNYEEGGTRYPAVPCTYEEQIDEIVQAVEAGCAASHIHPRDPSDCFASHDRQFLEPVYDGIFDRVDDVITFQDCWDRTPDGIDYITPAQENMEIADGSNKYVQGSLVLWPPGDSYDAKYGERVREGIEFYQENDIKPLNKVRSQYNARRMYRELIETGVIEPTADDPLVLIHDMGHPMGWPMDEDPWMPFDMITSIEQNKERFPEHTKIGVFPGGRNWLPITMTAILYGVDIIRIGIEDFYWMYPHRNEVIQRNMDIIQKVMDFCELVGREVATVEQARDILGIEVT